MKIAVLSRNPQLYSTRRLREAIVTRGHSALVLDHMRRQIIAEQRQPSI